MTIEESTDLLAAIRRRYLQLAPIRSYAHLLQMYLSSSSTPCADTFERVSLAQQFLMKAVIDASESMVNRPPRSYTSKFVKRIIEIIEELNRTATLGGESQDIAVEDALMERFCALTLSHEAANGNMDNEVDDRDVVRKYELPPDKSSNGPSYQTIALTEDFGMTRDGTTGLRSWTGGIALSEYLATWQRRSATLSAQPNVAGKSVLELGAGCGLLALTCAALGAKRVVATDTTRVVSRLRKNVEMNLESSLHNGGSKMPVTEVAILNWGEAIPPTLVGHNDAIDLILATDVIFDPTLISPLVVTLDSIIQCGAEAFIVSTVRNSATYERFLDGTRERGLIVEVVKEFSDWWKDRERKGHEGQWWYCEEGTSDLEMIRIGKDVSSLGTS
ncbi:hypothetical protein M427DRAFT_60764 [Gonapodya prolifera JEL478]|uniref:S-adenosyl-L-methionine-dependent methyltransferase n=1 Tax=Gonapodya prolifera (strain JEL478) TaxID=1344416 RepID=A0A139A3V1_GONPJ|nr:hypothetical protein M427DRAFT_60764 [Gonapodya prolifera JEL478]|eukprot:KXS11349.1 hypothetical protein M427DRAFT_60764 [Gonapodya prolifera JEL478]